jgi:acetate kinase
VSIAILVLNAGSSSLKFSVFLDEAEKPRLLLRGQAEGLPADAHFVARDASDAVLEDRKWDRGAKLGHEGAMQYLLQWLAKKTPGQQLIAAGHRVVHGGVKFHEPVRVDESVLQALEKLVPLAPLHQPHNVSAMRAVARFAPNLPQVACFDTAFHRTQPRLSQMFALPRRFTEQGVLRYGFHGLSYEYIASILPTIDPRAASGRTVVAHLGNGASLCAMRNCRSVATTMGFTPLDGLLMGTRCGAIDPGVLLYLMQSQNMEADALEDLLYEQSGLLGISGISSDVRTLLASNDPRATEAIELFVYRIGRELGSMAAALGGLDALVFTGGIGENAAAIRQRVCQGAAWLGIEPDESANTSGKSCITRAASRPAAWIIPTNEELMIAMHTKRLLSG